MAEVETWQNQSKGRVVLKKAADNRRGSKDEMISGGRTFHITPSDRHLNQELAANDKQDPFKNGILSPVRLLETTEDAAEIEANPNLMGESEMKALVKGPAKALAQRLTEVGNPILLERLLEVARSEDASVTKVDAIAARLEEAAPTVATEAHDGALAPSPATSL